MQTYDVGELLLLSVLWGAAHLFMRAAVPAFGPAPLIALRMAIAVAVLLGKPFGSCGSRLRKFPNVAPT